MFEPVRSLLNPKFEGYKLDALDQDKVVARFPLSHKLSQTTISGRVPLSFQEVQSRIRHNHLGIGPGQTAAYVDEEYKAIALTVDEATQTPRFEVIYELPRPIQTASDDLPQREYPSASFLNKEILVVSDGFGSVHLLKLTPGVPVSLLNVFDLIIPAAYGSSKRIVPFRVHLTEQLSAETATLVLSSKYYSNNGTTTSAESSQKRSHLSNVKFDVWAVRLNLNAAVQAQPTPLDILWHRRGEDVPQYISHDASRKAIMLLGSCPYRSIRAPALETYEPTSDEIAPIPRAGENFDGQEAVQPSPPYSWTQTSDSVTIAFPLPISTPKHAIKVAFSPRTLTVLVAAEAPSPSVTIPKYTAKALWDGIQASTSLWTWDKEDSRSFGVLTLHLDKQHEGTRWAQVFAAAGNKPSSDPQDVEVPETLDPSELYNIRENMEKFTEALQSGGKGIPSLAEGEMDEEIDSEMGKWSFITWVNVDGTEPSWAQNLGMDAPISVLSTPIPGLTSALPSIVVKNGVDGVVFSLQPGSSPTEPPSWKHTSTFSALSFVLASKRDTRFVYHVSSNAVLSFESGSQGNVYMYRNTAGVHDQYAKQAVLKIASGMAGSVLGVGVLTAPQGRPLILGLCEGELVVARGVL